MFVGISGGMGSGKTTVCSIFECLNIPIFYADDEAKQLYSTDENLKSEITALFGEQIYPNGQFDKKALAQIVFKDASKLDALNAMVHPKVLQLAKKWEEEQSAAYCIKEAALLFESGGDQSVDKVIVVSAPKSVRIERIKSRDGLNIKEIENRMNKQMSEEEKMKRAHFVVTNDEKDMLLPQVLKIHRTILDSI